MEVHTHSRILPLSLEFVVFRKEVASKNEETGETEKKVIEHHARIVTYIDEKRKGQAKLIRLLTNDLDTEYEEIVAIYKARWAIESLFYDKFIVMRSHSKCISDYQNVTYLLLFSALHNNMVAMTSFHLNVRTNGYQKDFL